VSRAEPGAAADGRRLVGFWDFKLTRAAAAAELGRSAKNEDGMTDAEYKNCNDPVAVIEYLRARLTENDLRWLGCLYLRRIWFNITDSKVRQVVDAVERWLADPSDASALAAPLRLARQAVTKAQARRKEVAAMNKRTKYPSAREARGAMANWRIACAAVWLCDVWKRPTWAVGTQKANIARFFRTEAKALRTAQPSVRRALASAASGVPPTEAEVDERCKRLLADSPGEFRVWVATQPDAKSFALAQDFAEALYRAGAVEVWVGKTQRKKRRVAQVLSLVARMPDGHGSKRTVIAVHKRLAKMLHVTEPMTYVGEHLLEVITG
jgi:hypothetical protein